MKRLEIIQVKNGYIVRTCLPMYNDGLDRCYVYPTIEDVAKALPELIKEKSDETVTNIT